MTHCTQEVSSVLKYMPAVQRIVMSTDRQALPSLLTKVFRRKVLLTTCTAINVRGKSSWVHAATKIEPDQPSRDNWKTATADDLQRKAFQNQFPGFRSRQQHKVDNFSKDHGSRTLLPPSLPFLRFPTHTHTHTHTHSHYLFLLMNTFFLHSY